MGWLRGIPLGREMSGKCCCVIVSRFCPLAFSVPSHSHKPCAALSNFLRHCHYRLSFHRTSHLALTLLRNRSPPVQHMRSIHPSGRHAQGLRWRSLGAFLDYGSCIHACLMSPPEKVLCSLKSCFWSFHQKDNSNAMYLGFARVSLPLMYTRIVSLFRIQLTIFYFVH